MTIVPLRREKMIYYFNLKSSDGEKDSNKEIKEEDNAESKPDSLSLGQWFLFINYRFHYVSET